MTTRTMTAPELGWAACCICVATAMLGCTAETSGQPDELDVASDESNLGEVSQALESYADRPAVAAVGVGVNGGVVVREMWVFACKTDNVLYRRVKPSWTSSWGSWTQASSIPCSGVATAGAGSALPKDDVEVFYRSTTGKLIELYYRPNGTTLERDLSAELGLGSINGNPVISDMGTDGQIAVAYRTTSNLLKTVTWTDGVGWVVQSVISGAATAHADGALTAMYTTHLSYLSASYNGTGRVFSRTNWADPYVRINANISNPPGVLTFTAPTPTSMLVLNRDGINRVTKSAVVPGQAWSFTVANSVKVLGTPYMGGAWNYDAARSYQNDRGVSYLSGSGQGDVTTLWGLDNSQTVTYVYVTKMRSGGTRPVNPGNKMDAYVFFASENQRIHGANLWDEGSFNAGFYDMGINVVLP